MSFADDENYDGYDLETLEAAPRRRKWIGLTAGEKEKILILVQSDECLETVVKFIEPEHAEALAACSIEFMVDATRSGATAVTSEDAIDRAWQRFQSVVNLPDDVSVVNPFAALNPTAFKSLAKKLNINNLLRLLKEKNL